MLDDELVIKKRAAAIKLAKELQPYDVSLGPDFLPVYMEILTEDMKQIGRDNRKLAKDLDEVADTLGNPRFAVTIDGEVEIITKLMRRYSTRITKACDLLYNGAYIDFEQHEEDEVDRILEEGDDDDS